MSTTSASSWTGNDGGRDATLVRLQRPVLTVPGTLRRGGAVNEMMAIDPSTAPASRFPDRHRSELRQSSCAERGKAHESGDLVVVEPELDDEAGEGAQAGVDGVGLDLAGHRVAETSLGGQGASGQPALHTNPSEDVAYRRLRTQRGDLGG
jgi:hypothetical protein